MYVWDIVWVYNMIECDLIKQKQQTCDYALCFIAITIWGPQRQPKSSAWSLCFVFRLPLSQPQSLHLLLFFGVVFPHQTKQGFKCIHVWPYKESSHGMVGWCVRFPLSDLQMTKSLDQYRSMWNTKMSWRCWRLHIIFQYIYNIYMYTYVYIYIYILLIYIYIQVYALIVSSKTRYTGR